MLVDLQVLEDGLGLLCPSCIHGETLWMGGNASGLATFKLKRLRVFYTRDQILKLIVGELGRQSEAFSQRWEWTGTDSMFNEE